MQITCKCLNFVIEVINQNFEAIDKSLRNILGNDPFFKEDIATVDFKSLIKKLPELIEIHNSGPWVVHRCMNCEMHVYAYNEETGISTNTIIVNRSLLTDPKEISALMESEMFSPVFKIIINQQDMNPVFNADPGNCEINTKLLAWIEEQTALIEERVQTYAQKQYAELEKMKARARKDRLALSKIFSKSRNEIKITPNKVIMAGNKEKPTNRETKAKSSKKFPANGTYLDSEGLFALDDVEAGSNGDRSDDENISDVSDGEELFPVSRRPGDGQFAQSLPVPVPQFMQDRQHNNSSNESPQVPTDIAASIKALAKSVHGDTIFGELPRPRFRTHL